MIHQQLKEFGLLDSEINVYITLLTNGVSTPPDLAKKAGIARTNLYPILNSLITKGLINELKRGKRKTYLCKDPSAFINQLELRKEMMKKLVPDLQMMSRGVENKPQISFYENCEGVKELFIEMLNNDEKKLYGIASTKKLFDKMGHDFFRWWGRKLHKLGIELQDILTKDSLSMASEFAKTNIGELYSYKGLSENVGDIPSDILVWDDNIVLISLEPAVFATHIKNQAIADTIKLLLRQTWKSL